MHFLRRALVLVFIFQNLQAEPKVLDFFYTPEFGHAPFLNEISNAKSHIQLAMYHLSSTPVVEALKTSALRGVKVQVLTDGKSLAKTPKYQDIAQSLRSVGIEVKGSTKGFSLMHEKALVVDQSKILITNINLTSKYASTRDFGVSFTESEMIKEFLSVFEADWSNADTHSKYTPPLQHANLIWSPINAKARLIQLLNSSQNSVSLMVESLGDAEFLAALAQTAERGVQVRILAPECNMGNEPAFNYPALKLVIERGVKVQIMPIPADKDHPFIHAKMIATDDRKFYIGSQNFSFNSLNYAREVGVILEDPNTTSQIQKIFEKDWSNSLPLPKENPTNCSPYPQKPL